MSAIRKELEFPAPLEGWEIDRYGRPDFGEMFHDTAGWFFFEGTAARYATEACYLIARKKQSPAEWANAQPDLAALARIVDEGTDLYLNQSGEHNLGYRDAPGVTVFGFTGESGSHVESRHNIWRDAP